MGFSPGVLPLCGDVVLVSNFVHALHFCVSPVRAFRSSQSQISNGSVDFLTQRRAAAHFLGTTCEFCHPERSVPTLFPAKIASFRFSRRDAQSRDLSSSLSKTENLNRAISNLKLSLLHQCLSVFICGSKRLAFSYSSFSVRTAYTKHAITNTTNAPASTANRRGSPNPIDPYLSKSISHVSGFAIATRRSAAGSGPSG